MEKKPYQEINISEKRTIYDVELTYHSDMKCQNYDAKIIGIEEENGKITLEPHQGETFEFIESDPDRVIAIAEMIKAFAQMAKRNSQKTIDTNAND